MNYVPLYIKTHNTLLSSMIRIDDLIFFAKKQNIKALTITDDNLFGAMDFYTMCKENDIKPIVGLEITLDSKIVLYARNYQGYKNLMKLSTISTERKITPDDLNKYSSDLICILPFESLKYYDELKKIYEYIFWGYKNEDEKEKLKEEKRVFFHETLTLTKDDEPYLRHLEAIKNGKTLSEITTQKVNTYIVIKEEENNKKIIDLCDLEMEYEKDLLPVYTENSFAKLKELCILGLKRIFGDSVNKKYQERLKYELDIINKMGFCNYFLVVYDYVKFAKENGILVGPGRGSAAGSLVSYLLNITTIDPIRYDLLFERFLNPERVTMPDIDIDFEDDRRGEVVSYIINKYGTKKVAPIMIFGTMAAKQAIRDVGRVMEAPLSQVDLLAKLVSPTKSFKENLEDPKVREYLEINTNLKNIYRIASKFSGMKRHVSIHACGIVMSKKDLDETIPLYKDGDFYLTATSSKYLESQGLFKMDLLALKNLTLIKDVLNQIGDLNFDDIVENDKNALSIFTNANTEGIFQFNSEGMINFLRKLKPTTFEDLFAAIALYRPGPMENIDTYIRRRRGIEKVTYLHPDLEKILKPTYGIIIYQEQIMQIAVLMAGFTMGEADILRSAMSKKKEAILLKEKDKFINGCINNGYSKEIATRVYELILKFASYGFNRSHSVVYSIIAYKMAYLKYYYPKEFMCALLSSVIGSDFKTKEYVFACKANKINILKPSINESFDNYKVTKEGIRYPLTIIKNVGTAAGKAIIEERNKNGKFKDIFDFVLRCYGKAVNKKTLESLIYAGAFESMGYNKKTLIDNLEVVINYGEIGSYLEEDIFKPELDIKEEFKLSELMNRELELFGFYLSNHPVTRYKTKFPKSIEIKNARDYFDKNVELVVYVERAREIETKKNDKMMFLTGSDELSKIDIIIFPKLYSEIDNIVKGDILHIYGKIEKRYDKLQVIATKIEKVNEL